MSSNVQGRVIRTVVSKHNITTQAPSRTDQLVLRDAAHSTARDIIVPQIQRHQHNSVTFDRRDIFYYFKKIQGRECSCTKENNVAEGKCPICFKTGWVGGFDKFGTQTEILDITHRFNSVNLRGDYTQRPVSLGLDKDSIYGMAIFNMEVRQNTKELDLLQIIDFRPDGANIVYSIFDGINWVGLTEDTLTAQLGQPNLQIKVEFTRLNASIPAPRLTCIRIRYNLRNKLELNSDWPHPKNSRALSEYGIFNQWTTAEVNLDNIIPVVTPEDWIYRSDRNERWKIIESDRNDPLQLNIGWNLTARLIHAFEIYAKFPL